MHEIDRLRRRIFGQQAAQRRKILPTQNAGRGQISDDAFWSCPTKSDIRENAVEIGVTVETARKSLPLLGRETDPAIRRIADNEIIVGLRSALQGINDFNDSGRVPASSA